MSLEQAINELNATVKQLIVVMSSAAEADAPAAESTEGKRKRRTKAEIEAEAAAQQTRYWHIAAHSTVYEQKPGEPDCTLPGAVLVTQADYEAFKAKYAAQGNAATGTAAAAPAPSTPAASTASAPVSSAASTPSMADVTAKLMALHKRDGNAGVAKVLTKFGVAKVPELASKDLAAVDKEVEALLNPAADNNLFG